MVLFICYCLLYRHDKRCAQLKKIPKQLVKEGDSLSSMSSYPSIKQCDDFSSTLEPSDLRNALHKEEMETPQEEKEPPLNHNIKGISFQPGGVLTPMKANIESTERDALTQTGSDKNKLTESTITNSKGRIQGLDNRTNKLIQDMSVPVKCDKAIKIMQVMGWTGGGLGLREKGRLEPIMPTLNTVQGVGLGHVGTNKEKAEMGDQDLHRLLIISIIELLCSDAKSKTVNFPTPIQSKIKQFINNTTTKLGSRLNPVPKGEMMELGEKAREKMRATPNVFINSYIPTGDKELVLTKMFVNVRGKIRDSDVIAINRRTNFEMLLKNEFITDLTEILDDLEPFCRTKKSNKCLQFKLTTLLFILEFARSKDMSAVKSLNMIMTKEYKRYLDLAIHSINKGEKVGETIAEQKLSALIHRDLWDMHLTVDLKYLTEIIVRKFYCPEKPEGTANSSNKKSSKSKAPPLTSTPKNLESHDIPTTGYVVPDGETPADNKTGVDIGTQTEQVYDEKNEDQDVYAAPQRTKREMRIGDEKTLMNRTEIQRVHFVPIDYPDSQITNAQVQSIQMLISSVIEVSSELPLLKCDRVEYGALVYSCYDDKSVIWLKNICSEFDDILILDVKEDIGATYNLALKFNCFFNFGTSYLFDKLELYNSRLSTSRWVVQKRFSLGEHVTLIVNVDEDSYNYICESGFSLHAGVDVVQFIIV